MKVHAPNACPSCGKRISAMRLLLGPERFAFKCAGCGARLIKRTRAIALGVASGALVASLASSHGYFNAEVLAACLAAFAITALIASVTVSVRVAGPDVPDLPGPPEGDTRGQTRDGPPPLNSTFRGMSAPPPKQD